MAIGDEVVRTWASKNTLYFHLVIEIPRHIYNYQIAAVSIIIGGITVQLYVTLKFELYSVAQVFMVLSRFSSALKIYLSLW